MPAMMPGRILAIGDVHGCHQALAALVRMVNIAADDTVIFLGDLVNRGPGTRQVLEHVVALQSQCNVIVVRGNHEETMRRAIAGKGLFAEWIQMGGQATLDSYGGSVASIPADHLRLINETRPYHESDTDIFVHACVAPGVPMEQQNADCLRWIHITGTERPHISGKRVICGHTPQKKGAPWVFPGWVCIDTFAHGGKWLTCLDVGTNDVYQAAQTGLTRVFPLARYA